MGHPIRRWGGLRLGLIVGVVAAAVAIALAGYHASGASGQAGAAPVRSSAAVPSRLVGIGGFTNGSPFVHGYSMSLSDAQAKVGFNIPRPDAQLASDSQIKTVWVDTSAGAAQAQIEVEYTSGLYVELGPALKGLPQSNAAQLSFFQEQVAEDAAQTKGAAFETSVGGHPALVIPQNSALEANGQSQGNSGDIEFVVGGEVIDISGNFATDDLLAVASTVSARPA
jgi:hypothetical protein